MAQTLHTTFSNRKHSVHIHKQKNVLKETSLSIVDDDFVAQLQAHIATEQNELLQPRAASLQAVLAMIPKS